MRSADRRRSRDDSVAQSSLAREPIERVWIGSSSTMMANGIHDSLQRLFEWRPTMDLHECFAIVNTDTDLQSGFTGRFVVHDPTDLESDDFSADDPVFDHHIGSALENHRTEFEM